MLIDGDALRAICGMTHSTIRKREGGGRMKVTIEIDEQEIGAKNA